MSNNAEIPRFELSLDSETHSPAAQCKLQGCVVPSGQGGHDGEELSAFLSLVQYDNHYRVDEVLKESSAETTQKVTFVAENGTEQGPYIRKYLKLDRGIGSAYKELYAAQERGARFVHLPQIYALYQFKDELVVVMEFVQGETLQDVVYRCDPSPDLAMEVFPQICDAVRELHERLDPPIIHRDLKPTNLILSWSKVTLIDFGIARTYRAGSDADTTHFGTRAYAPPEQFGFGQTDVRSDVYALGMLLFYCLTERTAQPEDRENGFRDSHVPEAFRTVIEKACSFDPGNRFASVAELQQAFSGAAASYRKRSAKRAAADTARVVRAPAMQGWSGSSARGDSSSVAKGERRNRGLISLIQRIPYSIGMVWNVALGLLWLLIAAVCVSGCFAPRPDLPEAGYPLWFRAVEYLVFFLPSATCIGYELSDRRLLRRKFPQLQRWPLLAEFLAVGIVIPFVLAVVMTVLAQVAGLY